MTPTAHWRGEALKRPLVMTMRSLSDSLLAEDAMFQRVPPDARSALVQAAVSEGQARSESVSRDWGADPWTIAQRLRITVVESDADANFGSTVVFAEITLYRNAIERTSRYLAAAREPSIPDLEDSTPVFLAHELYHHLARMAPRPPFSRAYRVTLLRLGPWRWTSRVASLEEIAAGAFAQTLLGLKFHPRLIELSGVQQDGGEL
jgi:hypothetical protein